VDDDETLQQPIDESLIINSWKDRCRRYTRHIQICSCNIFGGSNITEGFDEVAKVLTEFFHHDGFLDVVPSDVVAGIVLVRIEQRYKRKRSMEEGLTSAGPSVGGGNTRGSTRTNFEITSPTINPLDPEMGGVVHKSKEYDHVAGDEEAALGEMGNHRESHHQQSQHSQHSHPLDPVDLETLETISRCSVFALAIYTHLIVIYMRPCTGACHMCCLTAGNSVVGLAGKKVRGGKAGQGGTCCCCLPSIVQETHHHHHHHSGPARIKSTVVEGDNFLGLNHTGLSVITENLSNTELVYVSFKNDTTHKVYAVFLDHEKEQVVIAIRGTLSLEDCITDAICDPIEVCGLAGCTQHICCVFV
jgi:hypothetical protein